MIVTIGKKTAKTNKEDMNFLQKLIVKISNLRAVKFLERLDLLFFLSKQKIENKSIHENIDDEEGKVLYLDTARIFFGNAIQLCFQVWILIVAFAYSQSRLSQYYSVGMSILLISITSIELLDIEGHKNIEVKVILPSYIKHD